MISSGVLFVEEKEERETLEVLVKSCQSGMLLLAAAVVWHIWWGDLDISFSVYTLKIKKEMFHVIQMRISKK